MNKITTNYCYNIVQNYLGYNVGIPVDYVADEKILEFLAYNDESDKTNRLFRDALIFGHSYELSYIDEDKKNRFDVVDPRFGIDVYKDSLENDELKAFIRLYCEQYINEANSIWKIEVYDSKEVNIYTSDSNFDKLAYVETRPHNFSQVPVVVFNLNQERQGIFEQVTSLQDAYNNLVSDQIDDADAFSDAYMVLKGVSPDKELADQIKQDKILFMDSDASAGYLTKQVNDSQVKNMLDTIRESIYKITNTPDFADPEFKAQSGVALQYKLIGFSNVSKAIMNRFEKALRKRIELFEEINFIRTGDNYYTVSIQFHQNLPDNLEATAQVINTLRGIVSNKTLLSMLPFINNVDEELENIEKEAETQYSLFKGTV